MKNAVRSRRSALRIRYLIKHRDKLEEMGKMPKNLSGRISSSLAICGNTMTLMVAIMHKTMERIELN